MHLEEAKESIQRYLDYGCPMGDFLTAVMRNDLCESFGRADLSSRANLFSIVEHVYNHVPMQARRQYVEPWLRMHRAYAKWESEHPGFKELPEWDEVPGMEKEEGRHVGLAVQMYRTKWHMRVREQAEIEEPE